MFNIFQYVGCKDHSFTVITANFKGRFYMANPELKLVCKKWGGLFEEMHKMELFNRNALERDARAFKSGAMEFQKMAKVHKDSSAHFIILANRCFRQAEKKQQWAEALPEQLLFKKVSDLVFVLPKIEEGFEERVEKGMERIFGPKQSLTISRCPDSLFDSGDNASIMVLEKLLKTYEKSSMRRFMNSGETIDQNLLLAMRRGHEKLVTLILTNWKDIDRPMGVNKVPVLIRQFFHHCNASSVQLVFDKGARHEIEGRHVLFYALELKCDAPVIECVCKNTKAKVKSLELDGIKVIHYALIFNASVDVIQYLIANGVDINTRAHIPNFIVNGGFYGATLEQVDIGEEAQDPRGSTLLFFGIKYGCDAEVIQYLIENVKDVDLNEEDGWDRTLLSYAFEFDCDEAVVQCLFDHGAKLTNMGDIWAFVKYKVSNWHFKLFR